MPQEDTINVYEKRKGKKLVFWFDNSITIISGMKYTAFGELRSDTGTNPTDYHEPKLCFGFKVQAVTALTYTHGSGTRWSLVYRIM